MKRFDYVYHQSYGIMLVIDFPSRNDTTMGVAACVDEMGEIRTPIVSDADVIPIEPHPMLEQLRQLLKDKAKR